MEAVVLAVHHARYLCRLSHRRGAAAVVVRWKGEKGPRLTLRS